MSSKRSPKVRSRISLQREAEVLAAWKAKQATGAPEQTDVTAES